MQRKLQLILFVLMFITISGCDSENANDDEPEGFAVIATLGGAVPDALMEFKSNDVLYNTVGNSGFSLTAVDGDITLIIGLQSVEADPLPFRVFTMGADEESRILATGSIVVGINGTNTVYNPEQGGGSITLQRFTESRLFLTFQFTGSPAGGGSGSITAEGGVDLTL